MGEKRLIVTEDMLRDVITEELKKSDVVDMFKKDRDLEKRIKKIASDVIIDLFRVLWQRKSFFEGEIGR